MSNILFDPQGASDLNNLIQKKVAPHLFIVCNYNVDAFNRINEDAKFIQGILNLYKYSIDTSLINKLKGIKRSLDTTGRGTSWPEIRNLDKDLSVVNYLRTYIAHNNNNNDVIDNTEKWLIKVIKKKQFETVDDYKKALKELEKTGTSIQNTVIRIINLMVREYSKESLKNIFEERILDFYHVKNHLIKEELRSSYLSRIKNQYINVSDRILADWCRKMYIGGIEEKINNLSQFLPKSKGSQKEKLQKMIAQLEKEKLEIEEQVAKKITRCQDNVKALRNYDFLDYYIIQFENRMKESISEISKKHLTMLPEGMIQYLIEKDFNNVSISN